MLMYALTEQAFDALLEFSAMHTTREEQDLSNHKVKINYA